MRQHDTFWHARRSAGEWQNGHIFGRRVISGYGRQRFASRDEILEKKREEFRYLGPTFKRTYRIIPKKKKKKGFQRL